MPRTLAFLMFLVVSLSTGLMADALAAEVHRATRLGNPATRFAAPLKTPDDLRRTLLSEALRDDVLTVLRLSEFNGDFEDFRWAAVNAPIRALSIPVGTVLPAMSTRHKGKPRLLRNVLWAGKKPIDAYEFSFISGERRYRVVTPKACSNFWAEEQLPPPKHELALSCEAPTESAKSNLIVSCATLENSGDLPESLAMLSMPMPAGARVKCVSGGPDVSDSTRLTWKFADFLPGEKRTVCATFAPAQPGRVAFKSAAVGERSTAVASQCETRVLDVPAALLEVAGPAGPVKVGGDVVYVVKVLNQNKQPLTHVKIVAGLAEGQRFVGGSGPTSVTSDEGGRVVPGVVTVLNTGEAVEWRIVVKADKAGEARFNVDLEADQFFCPTRKTAVTVQN
ncbi:MAG: hypothetical protein PHD37_14985 [Gallionellaceae bacterium]|nr:hypothetical protein [Gallionellaceae bacterium]